jgi:hypothetical protein
LVGRLGSWAGLLTAGLSAAALGLGVTTPPRSGPYCRESCLGYPYLDAAAFVPRDYLWMYPALLAGLAFVPLAVCVLLRGPIRARPPNVVGTCLAVLSVMQAGLHTGETAGLSPLSQYNPHGVFVGMEDLGYAVLALSFLFLGPGLARETGATRAAGWTFIAGGGVTLGLLVVLAAVYRSALDYRFEVLGLVIGWLVLITSGTLLAVTFARAVSEEDAPH